MREFGTVKWYDAVKGYGFIESVDGGDVYFSRQALPLKREFDPNEGDRLSYERRQSAEGKTFAHRIRFLNAEQWERRLEEDPDTTHTLEIIDGRKLPTALMSPSSESDATQRNPEGGDEHHAQEEG